MTEPTELSISLRDYVDMRIAAIEGRITREVGIRDVLIANLRTDLGHAIETNEKVSRESLNTANENIKSALIAIDKRFEGVNELRQMLVDNQTMLIPKAEANFKFDALEKRIEVATQAWVRTEGARGGQATLGQMALGLISFLALVVAGIVAVVTIWR